MINVFHGFLGSPVDFKFLAGPDVILHDVYAMEEFPAISPDDTLIGYSLGGRIALDIADINNFNVKKLVMINSHPGLSTEKERLFRKNFEVSILQDLKQSSLGDFMQSWNKLPIFLFDEPIVMDSPERYRKSAEIFDRYRLSNQKDHLPMIMKNKNKVLWIIGSLDEKYMDMAREKLIPNEIPVKFIEGGHRLFQHPEALLKILKDESVL